ncbi:N-acyl homoserine lactonase family protein [soil metagenome]
MVSVNSMMILDFGKADIDLGFVMAPGDMDGRWAVCPFPGYLFELSDGSHILVDNGPHRRNIDEPMFEYGDSEFAKHLKPLLSREDDPKHRLAELDLTLDDIDTLVLTHTHFDHAGNTADFSGTRILIHRDAHAFGRERWEQGIPGGIPEFADDGSPLQYELFEGDLELAEGLMLLETPGHAPGHMSLLVELPASGAFLLAIDAIYSRINHLRNNYQVAFDSEQARASGHRCIEIAEQKNAELIYGHDPNQWTSLRQAPGIYR